jgi:hypothetical protein
MTTLQDTGKKRKQLEDKYYTATTAATQCLTQLIPLLTNPGGFIWIEPSAGNGVFLNALKNVLPAARAIGLDIAPGSAHIEKADFFSWGASGLDATSQRIFFGNPPFGRQSSLARRFIQRAAQLNAQWIAFILPRSFEKPSLQKHVPTIYHLRLSQRLDANSFIVNQKAYDVPCVFQVWERQAESRAPVPTVEPVGFSYVKYTEPHDIAIRRVGVNAGSAFLSGGTFSPQSHYFIKFLDAAVVEKKGLIIQQVSAHEFPSNTTGPRSLSKGEITAVLLPLVQG